MTVFIHDPDNEHAINELWVVVSVDDQGNEGICAHVFPELGPTPLITGEPRMLEHFRQLAGEISGLTGKNLRLAHYTRDVAEEIRA